MLFFKRMMVFSFGLISIATMFMGFFATLLGAVSVLATNNFINDKNPSVWLPLFIGTAMFITMSIAANIIGSLVKKETPIFELSFTATVGLLILGSLIFNGSNVAIYTFFQSFNDTTIAIAATLYISLWPIMIELYFDLDDKN